MRGEDFLSEQSSVLWKLMVSGYTTSDKIRIFLVSFFGFAAFEDKNFTSRPSTHRCHQWNMKIFYFPIFCESPNVTNTRRKNEWDGSLFTALPHFHSVVVQRMSLRGKNNSWLVESLVAAAAGAAAAAAANCGGSTGSAEEGWFFRSS